MIKSLIGTSLGLFLIASGGAYAQSYPSKAVTIVVPFAVGGPNDILARIVADYMSRDLGKPVIIENAVGAGGTLGSARAAKAASGRSRRAT